MMNNKEILKQREIEIINHSLLNLKKYLEDDTLTDIWVDGEGEVSTKSFGESRIVRPETTLTSQEIRNILIQIANHIKVEINFEKYPVFEGTIPYYEARLTGIFPPWVTKPSLTIRKPAKIIYSLENYLNEGRMTSNEYDILVEAITKKKNIIIAGGTGTGKTTMTNAVLKKMEEITPYDSFYIVEDNAELQCNARFYTPIKVTSEDAYKAVKLALRCSPDRIIFGEVREGIVLWNLLDAWNTGHPGGVTTLHANSAEGTFLRMRMLLSQCFQVIPPVNNLVDVIVHLMKDKNVGIKVNKIITTTDYSNEQIEEIANRAIENF